MDVVADIEEALVAQWSLFGLWPPGALHDEDGLLWFETPIRHLPYNGVLRTRLGEGAAADAAIAAVTGRFRAREAECVWFVPPSATPSDLGLRLAAQGLRPVERATCMSLELSRLEAPAVPEGVAVEEVGDEAGVRAYSALTVRYWEIPDDEAELVADLHRYWAPGRIPGHRYLAFADGTAVGKGYLSLAGPPGVAAIYGMSVRPQARAAASPER